MLKHVGFIMDGNRRWAKKRLLPKAEGYNAGLDALKKVTLRAQKLGLEAVTVYAFSKENWNRSDDEIQSIMKAVKKTNETFDGDFKIRYMGDISALEDDIAKTIDDVEQRTAQNKGLTLNIALNYSGRDDIIHAAKIACDHGEFVEDTFEKHLSTYGLPPLDMIVRSGGEQRLSGFMLYECAYSELLFIDKLWPDMDEKDMDYIFEEFNRRVRNFGK